jgi:hypothetical protein
MAFAPAKQGGARVGNTKGGEGSKIMAIADRKGLPVAVHVESATPHEVTVVHTRHTGGPEHSEHKTVARCVALSTAVEGRAPLCLVPELSRDRRGL